MTETVDDQIKIAIGEILREADATSKLIIGAYNHSAVHATNVKALSSSKFKAEQLESCLKFLGLKTRDEENSLIFTNKATLADRIITKIEATFPSTCQDCGEGYRVSIIDQQTSPRLQCFLCLQLSHDCDQMKEFIESLEQLPTKPMGNAWICSGCYKKNSPLLSNNPRKRHGSISPENATPNSSPALPRQVASPALPRVLSEETTENSPAASNQSEMETDTRNICQRYINNQCPHGLNGNKVVNGATCSDLHPRRCYRYCRFGTKRKGGCQKGESCTRFHPKLCKNSIRSLSCYNENCKFVHLKSTKRQRNSGEPDNPRSRGQSQDPSQRSRDQNPRPIIQNQGDWARRDDRPNLPRVRYDSTASHQSRPITPALGGYANNSSEVSFLVRMIQSMKSDFQKDLAQLRDSISVQTQAPRWNAPVHASCPPPNSGLLPQHQAPVFIQDTQVPCYQPSLAHQPNPLWAQNVPLFSS